MKVTYFNELDNKRHVLIDDVSQSVAEEVLAKFGNVNIPEFYLPEIAIEQNDTDSRLTEQK